MDILLLIFIVLFILFCFAQFSLRGFVDIRTAPPVVHAHAAIMLIWLGLFVTQNILAERGQLGLVGARHGGAVFNHQNRASGGHGLACHHREGSWEGASARLVAAPASCRLRTRRSSSGGFAVPAATSSAAAATESGRPPTLAAAPLSA